MGMFHSDGGADMKSYEEEARNIAMRLYYLRKLRGFSQEYVADAIGISRAAVSTHERGRSIPNAVVIAYYAEIFGVTTDDILRNGLDLNDTELSDLLG